ncbi:hypothetical protein SHIRM173S_01803 [Streptomyces hirsutus]
MRVVADAGHGDRQARQGPALAVADRDASLAPVVPQPSKVVCVGLNYRNHIQEMGRDLPEHPTLFAKFADSLIGATDDIVRPESTEQFDWEVELAVVVGKQVRRAKGEQAEQAIAGFTVLNDITTRDWQFRTREWLQGKTWDSTTPVGPYLVTPDELPGGVRPALDVKLTVDGEVMQSGKGEDRRSSASTPATSSPPAPPAASVTPASPAATCSAARPWWPNVRHRHLSSWRSSRRSRPDAQVRRRPPLGGARHEPGDRGRRRLRRPGLRRAQRPARLAAPSARRPRRRQRGRPRQPRALGGDRRRDPDVRVPEERAAGIERGLGMPAAELTGWLRRSAAELAASTAGLGDGQWRRPVVTAQGRTVPATELPWMRSREVCVHAVDLDAGITFADLPADFLGALCDDVIAKRAKAPGPALRLTETDTGEVRELPGEGEPTVLTGPLAEITAYLTGRRHALTAPDGAPAPTLGPWL